MFPNPLTLDMVKDALRISSRKDDGELVSIIQGVIAHLEETTNRRFAEREQLLYLERLMECTVPFVPATIDEIGYVDDDTGDDEVLDAASWYVSWERAPFASVRFVRDATLPTSIRPGTVKLTLTVGAATMDAHAIRAVIAMTGAQFNNPEGVSPIQLYNTPQFRGMIAALQVGPGGFA